MSRRRTVAAALAALVLSGVLAGPAASQEEGVDEPTTTSTSTTSTTEVPPPPTSTTTTITPFTPPATAGSDPFVAPIQTFDLAAAIFALGPTPSFVLPPGTEPFILGMEQVAGHVDLGGVFETGLQLDGHAHQVFGSLQEVAVRDGRFAPGPWSLTASLSDFTVGGAGGHCSATSGQFACIPASNLGWVPGAVVAWPAAPIAPATELPPVVAGAPITVLSPGPNLETGPQLLCSSGDIGANAIYVCDANVALVVPASAAAGNYRATLTLTLV